MYGFLMLLAVDYGVATVFVKRFRVKREDVVKDLIRKHAIGSQQLIKYPQHSHIYSAIRGRMQFKKTEKRRDDDDYSLDFKLSKQCSG